MTLQTVLSFIGIMPGSAGSFTQLATNTITEIYNGSSTMRAALEARTSSGRSLTIEYTAGVARNVYNTVDYLIPYRSIRCMLATLLI